MLTLIILYLVKTQCQWVFYDAMVYTNSIFTDTQNTPYYYTVQSGGFFKITTTTTTPYLYSSANFITCQAPKTSYLTLDYNNLEVTTDLQIYQKGLYYFSFDLYYTGTSSNLVKLTLTFGAITQSVEFTQQQDLQSSVGFCDSQTFQVKTTNFQFSGEINSKLKFKIENGISDGMVSFRNFIVSRPKCYSKACQYCSGVEYNECTSCYYGSPSNGICPTCDASTPFQQIYSGCYINCPYSYLKYEDGFCQQFSQIQLAYSYFYSSAEQKKWSVLTDVNHLDSTIGFIQTQSIFGIFKYRNGIFRQIKGFSPYNKQGSILIYLTLVVFSTIPTNSGIQLKLNNSYYGSIYMNNSGLQFHNIKLQQQYTQTSQTQYQMYMLINIPQYSFAFSIIGNDTSGSFSWGLGQFQVYTGVCPNYCELCQVPYKCKTCKSGYFLYRDGTCVYSCNEFYQDIVNSTHCIDYDDVTPYSKYIATEYLGLEGDPQQDNQYQVISQTGLNFLKGSRIYYSFWQNKRVFGGQFVWAQAKFKRSFSISDPHHSIIVAFQIIFGPSCQGSFIYTIHTDSPITVSSSTASITSDESKTYKVVQTIQHSTPNFDIYWECQGNNEPVDGYCAFNNLYVAVHYCMPYCLVCTDQYTCTDWNSTYLTVQPKFSQSDCQTAQYFHKPSYSCKPCPLECATCVSEQGCLTCQATYTWTILGCVCNRNQFKENNLCFDCPVVCNQCQSQNYCIECLNSNFRRLVDGQCICHDGYYDHIPQCKLCFKRCSTCSGPNENQCLSCKQGLSLTISTGSCECSVGKYYDEYSKTCEACEDNNNILNDGCHNCQFQCAQHCTSCDASTVQPCPSICGDGMITGDEECEDGNQLDEDGCYQCKYKCHHACTNCILGQCQECATDGYSLDTTQTPYNCREICGDGLVLGLEQCDNPNDAKCVNCRYCSIDCKVCNISTALCEQCEITGCSPVINQCKNVCGDGYVVTDPYGHNTEQCEDGNTINYDGCSSTCQFQCQPLTICNQCVNEKCLSCKQGYNLIQEKNKCEPICHDGILVELEQCEDLLQPIYKCKNCQPVCQESCLICGTFGAGCSVCSVGYLKIDNLCYPVCGDGIIVADEECDDGNIIPFDGCLNCKFNCEALCLICVNGTCLFCFDGYDLTDYGCQLQKEFQEVKIVNLFNFQTTKVLTHYEHCFNCNSGCPDNCKICAVGSCLKCFYGYYLDLPTNTCSSKCGDRQTSIDELCDDGNQEMNDGCFECKYQCQIECIDCLFGKCIKCAQLYKANQSTGLCEELICKQDEGLYYDYLTNDCIPQCGDGIIVGNEECEDNNTVKYDGCFDCKYQCDFNCTKCDQGVCQECQIGYELQNQKCLMICGDGLKLDEEDCDDGNENPRDGCTNCLIDLDSKCLVENNLSICFSCQENCIDCQLLNNKVQCIQCKKGYFLIDNSCLKCSDKCEECEKTPNNCLLCSTKDCKICEISQGLYLEPESKICISKCGDGVKAGNEECDDGNQIDQDGCNQNCRVEKQFICNSGGCYIPKKKEIELIFKNSTSPDEFQLKYEDVGFDICDKLEIWIDMFESIDFKANTRESKELDNGMKKCEINFSYFKTIEEKNLIHILIPLTNNQTRLVIEEQREVVIVPRKVVFYSEEQKQQAETVAASSNTVTFSLQLIGPLTILLGGFHFFFAILEILTWCNNFYFLNVDYPLNVKIFFNKLQWGDIINIPEIISLNNPDDEYYFEAPSKFTEKGVNPLFVNNSYIFIYLILLTLLTYSISLLYVKGFTKKFLQQEKTHKFEIFQINQSTFQQSARPAQQFSEPIQVIQKKPPQILEKIYHEATKFVTSFRGNLIQVINLGFLDICLATILQLLNQETSNFLIVRFNVILSILGIIFIFGILKLYSHICSQHKIVYKTKQFSNNYSSVYDGINVNSSLALQYCFINMIRKSLFIFCTVYFYQIPLLQTSTCCISSLLNLMLIILENPFENKSLLMQALIPDLCIFFIVATSIVLSIHDITNFLSFDQKYFIGWIILGLIGLSIFIQLIFLFKQFYLEMKIKIESLKQYISKKKCFSNDQLQKIVQRIQK